MAWQPYTEGLVGTGAMNSATICGTADGSYWAYTGENIPQPEEVAHIINCLKDPSIARMSGVRIAGNKYFVVRAEEGLLLGKFGNGGMVACQSVQAFTLGVFSGDDQPAFGAVKEVEAMVNGFKELQY